jgi:transposase
MRRFVEGIDRGQATLFPECLEDWIDADNPVRVIDAFVDKLDLSGLGFDGVAPEATGRPSYHPSVLLKLYIYGYLVRVQSSRRLEREAGRNVEVMWLTGRLIPDHKTIADFRKDSGPAIKQVCVQFIELCRLMGLLTSASVALLFEWVSCLPTALGCQLWEAENSVCRRFWAALTLAKFLIYAASITLTEQNCSL